MMYILRQTFRTDGILIPSVYYGETDLILFKNSGRHNCDISYFTGTRRSEV